MRELRIKVTTEQKSEGVRVARDGRLLVSVRAKKKDGEEWDGTHFARPFEIFS